MPKSELKHACFISYKRPPKKCRTPHFFFSNFAKALRDKIEEYLTADIRTFLDEDLPGGAQLSSSLSRTVCESAVMIAVLVPDYLDSDWCRAEWEAMTSLETKRKQKELIIPVLLDGEEKQIKRFVNGRKWIDMKKISKTRQLDNVGYRNIIRDIAHKIDNQVRRIQDAGDDCSTFTFPEGLDPEGRKDIYQDPDPLEQ